MAEVKTETISVRILFFAQAREQTKLSEATLELSIGSTIKHTSRSLLATIIESFPQLKPLEKCLIVAQNQTYLDLDSTENIEVKQNDEFAVIPPISSVAHSDSVKMDFINLTHDEIDVGKTIASVSSPKCGATSVFIGTTRDTFEGKTVYRLEYEAYESMAILEIKKICNEIRTKWEVMHIAITHRLDNVPVESACVIVAISSSHRKEALEATQFAMERLKTVAPIWKKEVYEDPNKNEESSAWKGNQECFWTKEGKESVKQEKEEHPGCSK